MAVLLRWPLRERLRWCNRIEFHPYARLLVDIARETELGARRCARRNPKPVKLSLTEPRPLGRAGFQSLVYGAADAGSRDPVQVLKRGELEKNAPEPSPSARLAVTPLPAGDYDGLPFPPSTLDCVRTWDSSFRP